MALEPTADPPSEPQRLGWHKVESRGARKRASRELLPEYRLTSPHTPVLAWGPLPCMSKGTRLLPEDGGTGAGIPSHTEHAQALGEQHKGQ